MSQWIEPIVKNAPPMLMEALKRTMQAIPVPELNTNAWSLNVLREVSQGDRLQVNVVLPTFGLRSEKQIAYAIKKVVVDHVEDPNKVDLYVYPDLQARKRAKHQYQRHCRCEKHHFRSHREKGGVGKSTVASNLAVVMASLGCRVGLLDADVYGPSIPLMFGLEKSADVKGIVDKESNITYMIPPVKYDVPLMSIGFLVDTEAPMIWRGPMIASASMQLFHNVCWGQLDYLLIDLPPGTGDIQLTIAQKINVAGAIIVSTPQDVALMDVIRAKKMFDKVNIRTLGLIENMSYFTCDGCEKRHEIFASGGALDAATKLGIKTLGEIPLITNVRSASDAGKPASVSEDASGIRNKFLDIAHEICADIAILAQANELSNNSSLNNPKKESVPDEKKRRLPVL